MTGLASGMASRFTVLEAEGRAGGICASYLRDGYRFEIGGGHWIFGGDPAVRKLMSEASDLRDYRRRSAILFLGNSAATRALAGLVVPYPLQENLWALPESVRRAAYAEIVAGAQRATSFVTMKEWLRERFGETLNAVFFEPFHARYTADLYREIAPEDAYKTPMDLERVRTGMREKNEDSGYNAAFLYPVEGLDRVGTWMAERCDMRFGSRVTRIDASVLVLADGRELPFERAIATAPLDRVIEMMHLRAVAGEPDPHTSVMVLNLGVTTPDTPLARAGYHWLYVPDSTSGFHRIGYYSNVDSRFLPTAVRDDPAQASLYVETAFPGGTRLPVDERERISNAIIRELKSSGLIDEVRTAHATWIDTAYTWRRAGSTWVERAIAECRARGVEPAGRYGRWRFQGIAASIREGLELGAALRTA